MKGFKEAYKSIFYYPNQHGSHENLFQPGQGQWDVYVPLVFSQFFKHFWYISPCLVHKYLILDS